MNRKKEEKLRRRLEQENETVFSLFISNYKLLSIL
jgi:hypothetical protein